MVAQIRGLISDPDRYSGEAEGLGDSVPEARHRPAGPLVGVHEPIPIGFSIKHFQSHYR